MLYYLASPYSSDNPLILHARVLAAQYAVGKLFEKKVFALSPIVSMHPVAKLYHFLYDEASFFLKHKRLCFQTILNSYGTIHLQTS